jgi:hypothetical protein
LSAATPNFLILPGSSSSKPPRLRSPWVRRTNTKS